MRKSPSSAATPVSRTTTWPIAHSWCATSTVLSDPRLIDFFSVLSNVQRLVLGRINADFCDQGLIFQSLSSFTCFPLHQSRSLRFFKTFAQLFAQNRKKSRPKYRGSEGRRGRPTVFSTSTFDRSFLGSSDAGLEHHDVADRTFLAPKN